MKTKTINNIKKSVLRELGEGAVDITAEITKKFKTVLRNIAAFKQWSWLVNVPVTLNVDSGQSYITIPDYFDRDSEISLYIANAGREIKYIPPQEYARLISATDNTSSMPSNYTVIDDRFYFVMNLASGVDVITVGTINPDMVDYDSTNAIDGIQKKIPDHFESVVERGILEQLDPDNRKKAEWAAMYYRDLRIKKIRDGLSKGRAIGSMQDKATLSSRTYTRG